MRNFTLHAAILAVALPLAGCQFWFGGDDCVDWGASDAEAIGYRNPVNGQCDYWGGGGGGGCGDGDWAEAEPAAFPDWGLCYSECSNLAEDACLAAPGCRAAYVGDCPEGLDCASMSYHYFYECWAVAPSGPIQGGDCTGLDAYECSRHDDCVANHYPDWNGGCGGSTPCPALIAPAIGNFESCANEVNTPAGCYGDEDCGAGFSCNAADVCLPPPGCGPTPSPMPGEGDIACPAVCYGWCVPEEPEGGCYGDVLCDSIEPSCPAGTTPGIANGCWTGDCIPYGECSPALDPGNCYDIALCEIVPPVCPEGSVPGVKNSCYTGLCIPLEQCEMQVPCEALGDESSCIARLDCAPTYQGVGCSCTPEGCGCDEWLYLSCQTEIWW